MFAKQPMAKMLFVLMSASFLCPQAGAAPVSSEQARVAARNWLRRGYGFERQMGTEIEAVRTLAGTNGSAFHLAAVKGGGFVVLASDTGDSPVVAVSAGGRGEPDEKNPLWALLRRDLAARMCAKSAPKRLLQAAAGPKSASGASSEARWAKLLEDDVTDDSPPSRSRLLSASSGRASIADVRVGALVQSAWSQMDYRNYGKTSDDDICYNFYTPNHWPCGCVATAGAQVMRYHCYPTAPVVAGSYACAINESPASLTMKGGTYDWSAMTLVPANGCSAASREAIGKLTYDVGVSVGMAYRSGGSSSAGYMLSKRFVDRFQYANAVSVIFDNNFPGGGCLYSLDRFKAAVVPNFDAGLPVALGISDGPYGHVVLGDGYGYSDGDFFVHINLGWADMDDGDVWYMPSSIDAYSSIDSIVYNVWPIGASGTSIVSGRVLSSGGLPVAGATVRAVVDSFAPVVTTSDDKGIYALKVLPGECKIEAEKGGQVGGIRLTVTACVSPHLDENGSYWDDVCPQIGNVCDNDLTLGAYEPDPPEPTKYTVTFDLGEHGARTGGGKLVQEVEEGHAAVAPAVEAASGWTFAGWDRPFANVTADLTVTAQYEAVAAVASAGAWTADVEGVQKAADCKLVVVLSANYGGCWWSQQAQPIFESSAFRDWAAANGVYLVTSDASRLPAGSTDASDAKAWFSTLYWSVSHPDGYVYYPSIAVARPTDFTKAVGYAVVRNDGEQKVGGVPYDGTAASLIEGLATYLTETPDPPAPTKYTVTFDLGEHGARTGGGKLVQEVEEGHAAVAPAVEAASGWTFAGWDRPFANVTADLTVTAQYEAVVPALERTLPEARIEAFEAGKILFVLSGADWCPYTDIVKNYIQSLGSTFTDDFVLYYCNVDTDTTGMADGIPSYGAFDPVEFAGNWSDGLLAYGSGGVDERVQKVLDDALAAYGEPPVVNYYTVQFDANGGRGTMAAQSFACGQAQALSRNVFSWEGRAFAGWALSAGGEVAYANGAVVSDLTAEPNGVVTLYAVWVENSAGRLYGDADKSVPGGEKPPYASAAAVYDGYLYEGETVIGSVQVKIAKGKVDKKSGVFSAKVTATVQLAGETKKLSFKNGIADATGLVTAMMDKNGNELAVSVGVNGLGGTFRRAGDNATGLADGARNVFSGKSTADKQAAAMASWLYQGTYNVALDGGTLSVTVDKKGKAKVSGTVDGTAVSATSQLLVGDGMAAIPVVIVKKVALSFLLWLSADGTAELGGATGVVGVPGRIEGGSTFGFDADEFAGLFGGLYADCLPNGLSVAQNGTKWVVADGAKAGKLVLLDRATGELDLVKSKLTGNTSGLKLTYKEKNGTFTGSFKVYNFENGKIKSYTANVKGVLIGEVGYGTATISKAGSVKVWIGPIAPAYFPSPLFRTARFW